MSGDQGEKVSCDAPFLRESPAAVTAYRPGEEFFEVWTNAEEGSVALQTWVVSTVRGGMVFAIRKTDYTWVKQSKTSGDYGWATNIDAFNRTSFRLIDGPPPAWARTRGAAYTKGLPEVEAAIKRLSKIRAQMLGQRTKQRAKKPIRKPGNRKDGSSPKTPSNREPG